MTTAEPETLLMPGIRAELEQPGIAASGPAQGNNGRQATALRKIPAVVLLGGPAVPWEGTGARCARGEGQP